MHTVAETIKELTGAETNAELNVRHRRVVTSPITIYTKQRERKDETHKVHSEAKHTCIRICTAAYPPDLMSQPAA